jgi:hypothetical protein
MYDAHVSQVALAGMARVAGTCGLALFGACVAASLVLFCWQLHRTEQRSLGGSALTFLMTIPLLIGSWYVGPRMLSLLCFAALVALLQFAFAGWRDRWHWTAPRTWSGIDWRPGSDGLQYSSTRLRWLWLVVPLFTLWANVHGSFRVGLVILWVYLAVRAVEALSQRGQAGWGLVRRMALMGVVAGAATLINPYGPWLYAWLSDPATWAVRSSLDVQPLAAWENLSAAEALSLIAVGIAIAVWATPSRCDLTQIVALTALGIMVLIDLRNAPWLAVAAGAWLAAPLDDFCRNAGRCLAGTWPERAAVNHLTGA